MRGLFLLFASIALACGSGAVTDPLRAGFDADPRPVLGEWQTSAVTPPGRFDALLEREEMSREEIDQLLRDNGFTPPAVPPEANGVVGESYEKLTK